MPTNTASIRRLSRKTAYRKYSEAGRQLIKVDQRYPSLKRCSDCGHIVDALPLIIRARDCPVCETRHDRDINTGIIIKAAGLAVLAPRENVSGMEPVFVSCSR